VALTACEKWGVTLDYLYRGKISDAVRHDVAVRLAAEHPELVGVSEPARRAKAGAAAA
jgi:hypothetical protein